MNALEALTNSLLVTRAGWTLFHSAWEGLAIALLLAILLPAVRKRGARAAYAAACAALLAMALSPAITFLLLSQTTAISTPVASRAAALIRPDSNSPASATFVPPATRQPARRPLFTGLIPASKGNVNGDRSPGPSADPLVAVDAAASASANAKAAEASFFHRVRDYGQPLQEEISRWLPEAVGIWIAGVFVLSAWNLAGWLAVQRLKRKGSRPISTAIEEAAARIARQLGVAQEVRLLQSVLVDSPIVIGALKPVILLPAALVTELPIDQLESLLAHELAHVLRQDYLVNLLQTLLETLLFYHPAVWWISAKVRAERENCCDDLAIRVTADRATYVRALAAVAGARVPAMTPAATGGILLPRVRRILGVVDARKAHPARWLAGAAMISLCLAATVSLTVRSQTPRAPDPRQNTAAPAPLVAKEPQFPTKGSMRVGVADADGKPLSNASVRISVWTYEKFRANHLYTCDSEGVATVALPKALWILRIWAEKHGYSGGFINFQTNAEVHELVIPAEYVFRLAKATAIGGVVEDEEGRPIKGARVAASPSGFFSDEAVATDENGRWKIDGMPPDKEIMIRVQHPDYVSARSGGELQKAHKITMNALRAQNATIVMRRGLRISGKVVDPQGKPVLHAILLSGDDPYFAGVAPPVVTDEQGRFKFPALAAQTVRMTVIAKGWMPETRQVAIASGMGSVDFHLKPGKKLRIRFVDRNRQPIPKVNVQIEQWKTVRNLITEPSWRVRLPFPKQADNQGVFAWDWAPDNSVKYNFSKDGYANMRGVPVTAGDGDQVQVLNPLLRISGRVRDSATGRPIDKFLLVPVIHFRPEFPSLDRNRARRETHGRFDIRFDRSDVEHGVQIEAPGYRTFRTTDRWKTGDDAVVLDVRLVPGPHYVGSVIDKHNRPIKDARVYLASAVEQLAISPSFERALVPDSTSYDWNSRIKTDANGGFEIPSQLGSYALVAFSPQGYGEIWRAADEQPGELRIHRWAKVAGRLLQAGKPVPNCDVWLSPLHVLGAYEPHFFLNLTAKTQNDGSFTFEHAPPLPSRVHGWLHFSEPSPLTSSQSIPLQLAPGETANVTFGGKGIDVTGQLVARNQPAGFDYHFAINFLVARRPGIETPARLRRPEFDWKKGWSDAWRNTPEGSAYLNTLEHWFVKPEPDGRFRISGVEPGEYDFAVNLYGTVENCLVHPIVSGVVHFSVSPSDKHRDLGKLTFDSLPIPKPGDPAADFEIEAPGGGKTSLAALRGNYVLVDFWATWCAACVAKLDQVDLLRDQFAGGKPLVVVGANLDANPERARQFLKSRPLGWKQAFLGDWSDTDVPRRYSIASVPAFVLIDPNGRIAAQETSLEAITLKLRDIGRKAGTAPKK